MRRSLKEYVVPYERLSATLQKINKQGGRVISLTEA
ncbi:MAG: phycobilisome linker polypeptide [Waterburya sp.]